MFDNSQSIRDILPDRYIIRAEADPEDSKHWKRGKYESDSKKYGGKDNGTDRAGTDCIVLYRAAGGLAKSGTAGGS